MIEFTLFTDKPSLKDNNSIQKYESPYLNLKEEDSTNDNFIGVNDSFIGISQISNVAFKNEDLTEIKQEVKAKPEASLHGFIGIVIFK